MDKITCIDMMDDINFKSPPNSRARTYADDAVGIAANSINNIIVSFSIPNNKQTKYIIIGNTTSFPIVATTTAILVSLIAETWSPTPTDKSPKGKAADVKIDNVFSIKIGKDNPNTLNTPPNKHATIKGFVMIDFTNEIIVILFLGTYIVNIETHKTFIKGIINVISNSPITNPSSLKRASVRAKKT